MKRLELSRLMDEYQDNEFFPEGGSAADTQAVKNRVLANVKPAKPKKRMPRKKKVLIAAALAAVMVVLVGAGYPYIQHHLVNGALTFQQNADGSKITSFVHYGPVVELTDGRLILIQDDGQRLDVTDLISEETPYIYDASSPDEGMTYYIIIGGTPDNYGYLEWVTAPAPLDYWDDYWDGPAPSYVFGEDGHPICSAYEFAPFSSQDRSWFAVGASASCIVIEPEFDRPWLLTGLDELGIPYQYPLEN